MKISKLNLPEEIFGMETSLLVLFTPILGLIILILISVGLVISPKISEYQEMSGQYKTIEAQKKQLLEKERYLQSIDQEELNKNSSFIANAMLPQKNSYMLVEMVEKIVAKYGYQINSFLVAPGEISSGEGEQGTRVNGVANIPITITIVGPAGKYLELIKGLETSLPVLSLGSFKMKTSGEIASIDLIASAYYITDNSTFDINKLSLADLTMTATEAEVINKLNQFTVLENVSDIESGFNLSKEYVKYERTNPFNP